MGNPVSQVCSHTNSHVTETFQFCSQMLEQTESDSMKTYPTVKPKRQVIFLNGRLLGFLALPSGSPFLDEETVVRRELQKVGFGVEVTI